MFRVRARLLKRFVLDGTIDGHDPIGVVLRITGGLRPFRLVVITANLGRGYTPAVLKANVQRIIERVDEAQHVLLLLQEIDEADPADEHELLLRELDEGTTLVGWSTREPIAVSPGVKVVRKRRVLLMEQGTKIGAPEGTGPRRDLVSCVAVIEGVRIGVFNQHPHRDLPDAKVQRARRRGERVAARVLAELTQVCDLVVWGGDVNDRSYPKLHARERNLHTKGNDTIRLVVE
jgi:endonuclease/exonuclease/phosphatase family metal-dependent hydrolase